MPMEERKDRPMCGNLKVLRKLNENEFGVEIEIMREGRNNNDWSYTRLSDFYKTFVGQPILCAYVGKKIGDGHNMAEKRDKTGKKYYSFTDGTAERIVGTLSDDENDFSLFDRDGHKWLRGKGRLFTFYAPELVEKIVKQGAMEVSAETEVTESHKEGDVDVFTEWAGLGVTILGDDVAPAIPGARIAALAAMRTEFNELKLKAASLRTNDVHEKKPEKIIKNGVKRYMTKNQYDRLSVLFGDYTVVGCSENGMSVALLDDKGGAYEYAFMAEDNGEVVKSRIKPCSANAVFGNGEAAMSVDLDRVIEAVTCSAKVEAGAVAALTKQLEDANAVIATMTANEHERRVNEVKDTITRTLAEINSVSEHGDAGIADEAEKLAANAEVYAKMELDGKFCGAETVRRELMAIKGEKDTKAAAEKAMNAKRGEMVWTTLKGSDAEGIEATIAAIMSGLN